MMVLRVGAKVVGILVNLVTVKAKLVNSFIVEEVVYATKVEASMVGALERVDATIEAKLVISI